MTQGTIETHVPSPLAAVVTELVELSVRRAAAGGDPCGAVDDLVNASRWNPALLMAAAQQLSGLVDSCSDDRFRVALDYCRAAEQRVRRRVY